MTPGPHAPAIAVCAMTTSIESMQCRMREPCAVPKGVTRA